MGKVYFPSREWDEKEGREQNVMLRRTMAEGMAPHYGNEVKREIDASNLTGKKEFFRKTRNEFVAFSGIIFPAVVGMTYLAINSPIASNHYASANYIVMDIMCSLAFLLSLGGAINYHYKMRRLENGLNGPQCIL